jgi:probable F420-dependent oxidoreductase
VAGEVADGLLAHGFTTERYLREATIPALERGLALSRRRREDVQVSYPAFVVTGTSEAEMADAARGVRAQIAFYGSTPAYRPVLELHGWGDLQSELNALSKQGEWIKMAELIDDEILHAFAVVAKPEDVPAQILARVGDVVDRITFYAPYRTDPERWRRILAGFKQLGPA